MIILLHLIRKVRITSPELQPMAVHFTDHVIQTETRNNNTLLPLVGVPGDMIRTCN